MSEIFGNHNEYIDGIDVKSDKTPDGFNENQIKDKARKYVESRIKEGANKQDIDELLRNIKHLLEKQDVERLNLIEELKQRENKETKEDIDKEAMINEAKIMLYEKLGISDNHKNNSKIENFLKGIVDELVIGNYELAIEIYNTNGKVIIKSLKQLASWEGIKKLAESLGESIWNLFDGDSYEKGKSVAQLGLLTTGVGLGVAVGKKGLKFGVRELSKLRKPAERVVESPEIKNVVGETRGKVDEIVPKKEMDFEELSRKNIDIERQVKGLEQLGIPESFSRDMLESGLMNEKFLGGDLLRRFEALNANKIDINNRIDSVLGKIPELTREEALLIFSYTDEVIFRDLNSYMRGVLKRDLTKSNINAINNIITKLESGLNKMPDLKPGKDGFILRGDSGKGWKKGVGEEIDLDAFTSVANNKKDAFIGDEFNTNIEISIIGKQGRIKDVSELSIAVNYGVTKLELETLTDFSGKLKKLPKTSNEGIILPNSKVVVLERYQGAETYYTKVEQTQ